jgi:hypothetical protein
MMSVTIDSFDRSVGLHWDRVLFRWGDAPDETCPEQIDVTGPPRVLVFGPFMSLEAGLWRAEVHYEVCDQAARRSYLVEFGSGADLSREWFGPVTLGRNRIVVTHQFADAAVSEIRFWVARAAFHGQLRFLGVTLKRVGPEDGPPDPRSAV